jgi:hypothetical protein
MMAEEFCVTSIIIKKSSFKLKIKKLPPYLMA